MTMISKCCESQVTGELYAQDGTEDAEVNFGKCSACGDFTFFDNVSEKHAKLLNNLLNRDFALNALEDTKKPYTFTEYESSWDKLKLIGPKCGISNEVIENFNPAIISWVAERIGITAKDGVTQALADGHFVINTAKEINNNAQVKMEIMPGSGTVLNTLNLIADTATRVLTTTNQKVVFHCAMGMERSVLACIWFMASQWRMQLHQSLQQIKKTRPIALDRTNWIIS